MLADHFSQKKSGDCGHEKGNQCKPERMRQGGAIAVFASWKCAEKLCEACAEINRQAQNRAELDDDGVHLPVAVAEVDVKQKFGDAQVSGGADGQKLGQPFDNSQDERKQIIVQCSSDSD